MSTPSVILNNRTSAPIATTQPSFTAQIDWILPVTVTNSLMILTFWLLISLIHYGIKTKKWSRNQKHGIALNSGLIYSWVVVCAIACLFRFIASLIFMSVGFSENEEKLCDLIGDATNFSFASVLGTVALFLWFRQRAFYVNELLNVSYNKVVMFFSYICVFIIVGYGISITTLILIAPTLWSSSRTLGCVRSVYTHLNPLGTNYWLAITFGVILYYSILLGLLSYALISIKSPTRITRPQDQENNAHNTNVQRNAALEANPSTQHGLKKNKLWKIKMILLSESKNNENNNSIKHKKLILQKTILYAILSIVSDIFSHIVSNHITNPNGERRVSTAIYNVNLFFNLLFLILSFTTYKKMMTSPFSKF